jgi:hypothetical protein
MNLLEFHRGSSSYSLEKNRKSQNKFQVQKSYQRQADPCLHETVSIKELSRLFTSTFTFEKYCGIPQVTCQNTVMIPISNPITAVIRNLSRKNLVACDGLDGT